MTNLFRNSSPGALTLQQSIEWSKKRMAEHRRQLRQAQELAAQGRGEDTEIAHVARGEYIIPEALQTPEVLAALHRAAADCGVPLERLNVGHAMNSINPNTGAPEFGFGDWFSGLFGKGSPEGAAGPPTRSTAIILPNTGINDAGKSISETDVGFDPSGPGEWGMALRHPWDAIKAKQAADQAGAEERQNHLINSHNDENDAWRHARWNQLMTQRIGAERAKQFSDAHERSNPNPMSETLMDLYNNQIGRSLAKDSSPQLAIQNAVTYGFLRKSPFAR